MGDWRCRRTARLTLAPLGDVDVDELFTLTSDPATARFDPHLLHEDRSRTAAVVARAAHDWRAVGLGPWQLRWTGGGSDAGVAGAEPRDAGPLVGIGGCSPCRGTAWNLAYRLAPAWWGRGLIHEVVAEACRAAGDLRPELPVVVVVLKGNRPSRTVAERAGLRCVGSGPDATGPRPSDVLLVFADRPLAPDLVSSLLGSSSSAGSGG